MSSGKGCVPGPEDWSDVKFSNRIYYREEQVARRWEDLWNALGILFFRESSLSPFPPVESNLVKTN